jgi:hypothetical protein
MGFHQERCEPGGVRRQLGEARLQRINRVRYPVDSRDAEPDQLAPLDLVTHQQRRHEADAEPVGDCPLDRLE